MSNITQVKFKKREINENQLLIKSKINDLSKNEIISHILALRTFTDFDTEFSNNSLYHYNLLHDINIATKRLRLAIENKELMCVVADYDADGATSCAIAIRGLKALGANVCYYVPNRFTDGYGLSESIVEKVVSKFNPKIILTVDNGITSFSGVELANKYDIDCIITDHHIGGDTEPKAFAIVNPNKVCCTFPSKNLAGCGVIFYLICCLRDSMVDNITKDTSKYINSLIDFVTIGTVADVVKLDKNNRMLIKNGLSRIRSGKSFRGIYSLLERINKDFKFLTCQDISFSFAPKINAAGRLDDMSTGIKLLISNSSEECDDLSNKLVTLNKDRVNIQEEMINSLYSGNSIFTNGQFSIVGFSENFHEGVVGIVASKLKEKYTKPTFIFAESLDNNEIKCSARSINGIHLKDLLDELNFKYPNLIIKYGGHSMAAGLTIKKSDIDFFALKVDEILYNKNLPEHIFESIIYYDKEIELTDIDEDILSFCSKEIWGQGYEEPIFMSNVLIHDIILISGLHTKFIFEANSCFFDGIIFNTVYSSDLIGCNAEIFYNISINRFRGVEKVQLMVKGLEINL